MLITTSILLNLLEYHHKHDLYRKISSFNGIMNIKPHQLKNFLGTKSRCGSNYINNWRELIYIYIYI